MKAFENAVIDRTVAMREFMVSNDDAVTDALEDALEKADEQLEIARAALLRTSDARPAAQTDLEAKP